MQNISTIGMSRIDWLKLRQKGIGGSDVAAVLGLSKWKTPLQVYEEKIAPEPIDTPMNDQMEAGIRLEETVAQWWADKHGFDIQKDNKVRFHQKYPELLVNLDRIIISTNGRGTGVLECKTADAFYYNTWEEGTIPDHYFCQVQHQFSVTGHKWGAIGLLVGGNNFKSIDVEPDPGFIKMMNERLLTFWHDHVVKRIPPTPSTLDETKRLFPKSDPNLIIEATEETLEAFRNFKEVDKKAKEFKKEADKLKVDLQAAMGKAITLTCNGETIATWKNDKDGMQFDKKAFETDYPELVDKYSKEKFGSRRFLTKDVIV